MYSSMRCGFRKNENCPSSQQLLTFESGELERANEIAIAEHLNTCEFCEAEVEFYSRFPLEDNVTDGSFFADIPAPLYELAEALLKKHHTSANSLNSLLKGKKGLAF